MKELPHSLKQIEEMRKLQERLRAQEKKSLERKNLQKFDRVDSPNRFHVFHPDASGRTFAFEIPDFLTPCFSGNFEGGNGHS